MERKRNSLWLYAAAWLIPCALLLLNFALLGVAPFGEKSILFNDVTTQYLDFASYLKSIFDGESDILYTFSKNLGGELVSLIGYYLISPFSLLFAFATSETLPMIFTAVIVLKLSTCGLTFFYAASRRFGCKWSNLIFSTAYALMGYNTLYFWNIMWMEGVLILPLLALGLENLWQGKKPWLYVGSLAYALLTNFYIGYMLCIASVIFSLALMAAGEGSTKERWGLFGKFLLASGIGGFAAAFCWLPTFFTLLGGRAAAASSVFVWSRTFNILGLAAKLVAGSANAEHISLGTPNIFCGIFTILLVLLFFLHGRRRIRSRLIALAVIGVFLISFSIRGLDVIWHGFSPNNAYNFRYAFILSYVLLVIAQYAWEQRRDVPKVWVCVSGALLLIMCAGLVVMKRFMGLDFISLAGVGISAVVALLTMVYLLLGDAPRRFAGAVFFLVCLFEMGANYYLCIHEALKEVLTLNISQYHSYVQQTVPAVEAVKAMDSGFYRMEKTFSRSKNDALFFGYNGLSHFSSSQDKAVPRFMEKMGMNDLEGIWAEYGSGSTAAVDTLLGVKYVLSKGDLTVQKGYPLVQTVGDIGIYENTDVMPIAMVSGVDVLEIDPDVENTFALQNQMFRGISGLDDDVFLPSGDCTVTLENLTETGNGIYAKNNLEEEAALIYTLTVSENQPLYLYFTAPQEQNVALYINGVHKGDYFSQYRWDMVYAGTYAMGEQVEIRLVPGDGELLVEDALFFHEDMEALSGMAEAIRENPVELRQETGSHLTGTVAAQEDSLLLLTIPYDTGWRLTVDGVPTEYVRVLDVFMAAPVDAGTHSFELKYIPRGSLAGCGLSAAAIAAAILWETSEKRKRQIGI